MVKIAVYLFCFLFCLLGLRHELKSQINTFPYNEGFEAVTGDWTNQTDDDMDWTTNQGGTPTGASGPAGANGGTKYLYTEASGFNHPSKRAYLEAEFDFTGIFHPQLSFFYHMYGANMGGLYVDAYDGQWNTDLWSIVGEQQTASGDPYKKAVIDLSAYANRSGIKIRFRGLTGTNWLGDVAIDDVSVCSVNPGTASISANSLCSSGTVDLTLSGAETGTSIQWEQSNDNLVFTNVSGATSDAHTTSTLAAGNTYYYRAAITNGCTNYSNVVAVVVAAGSGTISSFPYSEDFESEPIDWSNVGGDDFNWTRDQAGTPSNGTGPDNGNEGSTWYIYTEASNPNNPIKSAYLENTFDFTGVADPELVFYYHMFGTNSGNLMVDVGAETAVWSISGPQQTAGTDEYLKATVNLSAYGNTCNVKIRFRGVTGVDWSSDIAIDDIKVRDACLSVNGGTTSVSDSILCSPGTVDLSIIGQDGGASIQWQQSTDAINFSNIVGATSPNRTTAVLPSGFTYYYRASITNGCTRYSDTSTVIVNAGGGGTAAFPYTEDFELGPGIWTNGTGGDFNWTRDQGGTPSGTTGPSAGNASNWYVYTEASNPNYPAKISFLEAEFDFTNETTPTLSFFYHMFGGNTGTLKVTINGTTIWSLTGQQQTSNADPWLEQSLDLSAYAGICNALIRFEGITGSSWDSDIAIDDVSICSVNPGNASISSGALCSAGSVDLSLNAYDPGTTIQWQQSTDQINFSNLTGKTLANETTGSLAIGSTYYYRCAVTDGCTNYSNTVSVNVSAGGGISTFPYTESFEGGLGNWGNGAGSDFNWTSTSGTTPSASTGPSGAAAGSSYLFTEASNPNFPNKSAELEAEFDFTGQTNPQITFSYHMYGITMGNLFLDANGVNVWSKSGSEQGSFSDPWTTITVDLSDYSNACSVILRFRGETGNNFYSDMAIDDINVCIKPATSTITGTSDVCKNASGASYSVMNNPGNSYTWIIEGGSQASGGNSHNMTSNWGSTGMIGSVKVIENSGVCKGDTATLSVNIHTIETSEITGNDIVAGGTASEQYAVLNNAGYTYNWSVTGGSISSGQGSNEISINWGTAGSAQVNVVTTSGAPAPSCTSAPTINFPVTIYDVIQSTQSGSWTSTSSWDCSCIPDATKSVTILNSHEITLPSDQVISNLCIESGASLNDGGNSLTVNGDYALNGTHNGSGNLILAGINSQISGNGSHTSTGDLEISGGDKIIPTGTILTKSNGNISILDPSVTVTNNGSITIEQDLIGFNGTNHWINASNSSLTVGGFLLNSGQLTASAIGNSVHYNGTGNQSIKLPNASAYYNLTIDQSSDASLTGNVIVNSALSILGSSQLDATSSNYDIQLNGNWMNSSTNTDPFVENNASVNLSGSEAQSITNANGETFYDLTVDKSSGVLSLGSNTNLIINHLLSLRNGLVSATSGQVISLNAGSSASSNTNSYVQGRVRKTGNTDFTFPIGNGGKYARLGISSLSSSSTFEAEYYKTAYTNTSSLGGLNNVSKVEYWDLNRISGGSCQTTLYWEDGSFSGIQDLSAPDLVVAHWNSSSVQWEDKGGTYSGLASAGSVTSSLMSSFSPVSLASTGGSNTLPVQLLFFQATQDQEQKQVLLNWSTASEINNDYFTVQRAQNQTLFEDILQVNGQGNSFEQQNYQTTDNQPLDGTSYYRLKQTDFDGTTSYSNTVTTTKHTYQQQFTVFPNPVTKSKFTIAVETDKREEILLILYNVLGEQVYSKAFVIETGSSLIAVDPSNKLIPGVYYVIGTAKNELFNRKIVVQ